MSSKLWTSTTRGQRYWFTNFEQTSRKRYQQLLVPYKRLILKFTKQTTQHYRRIQTQQSRSPYTTWVLNNTEEKWLTNWSSHEPDLRHLTDNNFPLTQMMTSAEFVETSVTRQQSFSGLSASPGRSDYPNKSIKICSSEIIKFFFSIFLNGIQNDS